MKIINTKAPVDTSKLLSYLQEKLNPLFEERKQTSLAFSIEKTEDNTIVITQPDLYDDFLFRLEIKGNDIHIVKSEHYTDDVNVLTLEDILNNLLMEYSGRGNIDYIGEES